MAVSVSPATEQAGQYVADLLKPAAGKLRHLCAHMPEGLDADQRGSLVHSFALAASVLGVQTGETSGWSRRSPPIAPPWRSGRAGASARLGHGPEQPRQRAPDARRREDGTERLDEAVAAFRAALEVVTRERVPLQWAMTQNNLGNALRALGAREDGTLRLEQAVAAYRAALEVWTRERVPLQWAMTQNNLGNALRTLGEREDGTERLDEAVAAFRGALEVGTRERVPLDWAATQNNLGTALSVLGAREDGTERLEQAVAAFRAALEVWTRGRVPLTGPRPRTTSATRSRRSASARTAPSGWSRRSPPIAPPWR